MVKSKIAGMIDDVKVFIHDNACRFGAFVRNRKSKSPLMEKLAGIDMLVDRHHFRNHLRWKIWCVPTGGVATHKAVVYCAKHESRCCRCKKKEKKVDLSRNCFKTDKHMIIEKEGKLNDKHFKFYPAVCCRGPRREPLGFDVSSFPPCLCCDRHVPLCQTNSCFCWIVQKYLSAKKNHHVCLWYPVWLVL